MLLNVLIFGLFLLRSASGELLPETVPDKDTVSLNPLMPNNERSVRDCPFTYYQYGKRGWASSIFSEPCHNTTFAHVVKLATIDDPCLGIIIDEMHILTSKRCALMEPQTISFHNSSLPHWGIESRTYHLDLDIAVLRLKTSLNINKHVTPACFWNAPTRNGFSTMQHMTRDPSSGGLLSNTTKCQLSDRAQCFSAAKGVGNGFLQVKAISNYRYHPFVVAFGADEDGSLLEVSRYADWIQNVSGTSVNAIDCAVRNYPYREYNDYVVTDRSKPYELIQLQNSRLAELGASAPKVLIRMANPVTNEVHPRTCFGTLIHENYVLTVSSCLLANYTLEARLNRSNEYLSKDDPDYIEIESKPYLLKATVSKIYIHPNYSEAPLKNDIALLQLEPVNAEFQTSFKPACLWTRESTKINSFQTDGQGPLRTIAYADYNRNLPEDRNVTGLYLISRIMENCPLNLTANQICVGEEVTIVPDTCVNSLGSAMSREIALFNNVIYDYIFAINNKGENCGFDSPSTYTKLYPYIDWIDSIVFGRRVVYEDTGVYYGDECQVNNGTTGVCVNIHECSGILNMSASMTLKCGFDNFDMLVCCTADDSMPSTIAQEDREQAVEEIENCPELYSDIRKNRSPYNFRSGTPTYVASITASTSEVTCDGTLIAKSFVITSANCFTKFSANDIVQIQIGNETLQQRLLEKAIVHPKFNGTRLTNNLAILKLSQPVEITEETIPACLWKDRLHVPFLLEVTGANPEDLRIPTFPLYQHDCERNILANLSGSELCVQCEKNSKNMICHESGTGIYNYFAYGLYERQVGYIVGVYNRATGCESEDVGVFTRIDTHYGWIKSVIYRNI